MPKLHILQPDDAAACKARGVVGFSPSQVETKRLCFRKWGFRAINGIYGESAPAAEQGTACHTVWEDYLRDGKVPDITTKIGKICNATLRYLPLPGVANVEGEFFVLVQLDDGRYAVMTARVDFTVDDQGKHDPMSLGELPESWDRLLGLWGVPLIGDHKTTSDFKYAKDDEDLIGGGLLKPEGDAQATCYGMAAALRAMPPRWIDADRIGDGLPAGVIDLLWSYSRTKGANKALPVRARMTLTDLQRSLSFLWRDVSDMITARSTVKDANDLPAATDPDACDAFGGCPHRAICKRTNEEMITNMTSTSTPPLSALLGIGGMTAPAAAPAFAPPTAPAFVAPVAPPTAPAVDFHGLAQQWFNAGRRPDPAQCGPYVAEINAAFDAIAAAAQPKPPDAPAPSTFVAPAASAPTAPTFAPTAPAFAPPTAPAVDEKPKRSRKAKTSLDENDPIACLKAAIDAAQETSAWALVSDIGAVLAKHAGG